MCDILVVDDDALQRRTIGEILRAAGLVVEEVASGEAAVARARNNRFGLILMDIHLPGMDGFAAAEAIRRQEREHTPMVAFTSLHGDDVAARAKAANMDHVLAKPCTPSELIAVVHRFCGVQTAALDRMADLFGSAKFADLLARFRDQLEEAVAQMETADLTARAHRIGGLAGTLGFASLSAAWLALSEGNDSAIDQLRALSRDALREIDARL